jgi:hypothetical protein
MVIIQNTLLEHDENEQVCYLSLRSICSIHIYNGVDAFGMSWKSHAKTIFIANRRHGEWFSTTPPYAVKIQHLSI